MPQARRQAQGVVHRGTAGRGARSASIGAVPTSLRLRRLASAAELAEAQDGVVSRAQLRAVGVGRDAVRTEVAAGRWQRRGRQSVVVTPELVTDRTERWAALFEVGGGAALDGVTALLEAGLTGFTSTLLHVSVPKSRRTPAVDGVRVHELRSRGPLVGAGIPRVRVDTATVRAAQWAVSDRQAALILLLAVQQRLVDPRRTLAVLDTRRRSPRRALIGSVLGDCVDGVHSLGELDFAAACRRHGLPPPSRQVVRQGPSGRVYLDVAWEDVGLAVEIDGAGHGHGMAGVDDMLRQNEVTLGGFRVLRIPVVGLRVDEAAFMAQVVRAHRQLSSGSAA